MHTHAFSYSLLHPCIAGENTLSAKPSRHKKSDFDTTASLFVHKQIVFKSFTEIST